MIKKLLSRSANADPGDVLAVKRALAAAGLYETPEWGLTSFPDEVMFEGIETLQRRSGDRRPNGVVRPGDDTAHALARLNAGAVKSGPIHVNAYEQNRSGHATPVSEHFRGRPSQGNGESGSKGVPPKGSPVDREPKIRGCDGPPYGCGHYGASRGVDKNGKPKSHKGVDVVTTTGETVYSPVSGTVGEPFDPYGSDPNKRGKLSAVPIRTDDGHTVEVLYVDAETADLKKGDHVEARQPIGKAQDLSTVYPPVGKTRMTNHVDIRIKDRNGGYKDPTLLVRGQWPGPR